MRKQLASKFFEMEAEEGSESEDEIINTKA